MTQLEKNQKLVKRLERLLNKKVTVKETKASLLQEVISLSLVDNNDISKLFDCFSEIVRIAQKGMRNCETIPLIEDEVNVLRNGDNEEVLQAS